VVESLLPEVSHSPQLQGQQRRGGFSAGSNTIQISGDDISPPYHHVHARNDFPSARCSRQAEHRLCVRSPVRVVNQSPFCYLYSLRRLSPHYKLSWFPILYSCLDSMIFITLTESFLMAPRYLGSDDPIHQSSTSHVSRNSLRLYGF